MWGKVDAKSIQRVGKGDSSEGSGEKSVGESNATVPARQITEVGTNFSDDF